MPWAWSTGNFQSEVKQRFLSVFFSPALSNRLFSVNVLAEPQELYSLPFGLGERARRQNANVSAARYDAANDEETLGFPVFVPRMPARNYFVFGTPIHTTPIDPNDKEACAKVYLDSKMELRRGLDDVLRAREHDPFKDTTRRLAYERLLRKQAPTFSVNELNHHIR